MPSQSQGTQQLLQAEKRVKDKLEDAKKSRGVSSGRPRRLKPVKEEAVAEADQCRMQREEFRRRRSKIMGSQSNISEEIEEQTLARMKELEGHYSNHVESVVVQLLSIVCDVKSEICMNYRATD
nr:V-type proton ATPase subunit G 3 [Manis javanica]